MDINNLRFIVFLIDSKSKMHDGKVFKNLHDAREFALSYKEDDFYDKAVVGMFLDDTGPNQNITMVETYGFKQDKKQVHQLNLFKTYDR